VAVIGLTYVTGYKLLLLLSDKPLITTLTAQSVLKQFSLAVMIKINKMFLTFS
jgi:hypothetical protein